MWKSRTEGEEERGVMDASVLQQQSLRVSPLPSHLHEVARRSGTPPPSGRRRRALSPSSSHTLSLDAELLLLVKQFREHVEPGIGNMAIEAALRFRKQLYTTAEDEHILRQADRRCQAYMRNVESILHRAVELDTPLEKSAVHASYLRWRNASDISKQVHEVLDAQRSRRAVAVGRLPHEGTSPDRPQPMGVEAVPTPRSCAGRSVHPSPSYVRVAAMWRKHAASPFGEDVTALSRPYNETKCLTELQRIQNACDTSLNTTSLQRAQELMELLYGEEEGLAAFELWLASLPLSVLRQCQQELE